MHSLEVITTEELVPRRGDPGTSLDSGSTLLLLQVVWLVSGLIFNVKALKLILDLCRRATSTDRKREGVEQQPVAGWVQRAVVT